MEQLDSLINQYGTAKAQLDTIKKVTDNLNAQIKKIMSTQGITDYETDQYKVKYSVRETTSLNEDRLLTKAHEFNITEFIRTKEYIDMDVLENMLYHNEVPDSFMEEIGNSKVIKSTPTLTIKGIKHDNHD